MLALIVYLVIYSTFMLCFRSMWWYNWEWWMWTDLSAKFYKYHSHVRMFCWLW